MVGKKVKERMKVQGINPPELARRADMPITTLYTILREEVEPTATNLKKLADALGCTTDYFFSDPFADLNDPNLGHPNGFNLGTESPGMIPTLEFHAKVFGALCLIPTPRLDSSEKTGYQY